MANQPDATFFRNYFASYEMEPSCSEGPNPTLEQDLKDCHCALNCCIRFQPATRVLLRTWYQRLTPQGRVAFLNAHLREPSPANINYRLPTVGGPEKVCAVHFLNTLQETKKRIRSVILNKRIAVEPKQQEEEEEQVFDPTKRYTKEEKRLEILERMARGLSYRTLRYKKLVPARTVKAPCGSVCKYKCYERFTLADREKKLKELLQLSLDEQRQYLIDLVCKVTAKRPRALSTGKRLTIYYFFREGRQLHRVCKTMFLNTFDLSEKPFRRMMEEKGENAHVICGNPRLANALKAAGSRLVLDIDEGLGDEFATGNEEGTEEEDGESTREGVDAPSAVWIKQENMGVDENQRVDIKTEIVDPEAEQVAVPPSSRDDSVDDDSNDGETDEDDPASDSVTPPGGKQPRLVKLLCGTRCDMKCQTRISNELRLKLLTNLLKMSPTTQRQFLGDHICAMSSGQQQLTRSSWGRMLCHYFLPVESQLVKVCRLMFRCTYDLSTGRLREIIQEKGDNKHVVCGNPNFPSVLKKAVRYYFDYNEGIVNGKAAPESCKCSLRCSSKVSEEMSEKIQSNFRQKTSDEQYSFLFKYVQLPAGDKKLLFRARYFLPLEPSRLEEVCWKTFLATFGVDYPFVRTLLTDLENSTGHAKAHIAAYRMDEDHHCEIGGVRKLSRCPNVARMYNEYLEGLGQLKPIDYEQYFGEFNQYFSRTGLMLPVKCPDCGFFSRGEVR